MRYRIFLPFLLVLSAAAFSTSATAASDSTPHRIIQNIPPVDGQKSHGLLSA
ncbi:hypothetical protein NDH23_004650 [Salmonella enterica subsp. enterica serovar Muenchen]|uniref:PagK family vesicle-borne virulence factor n=1 Tax=Salmonella enterica TaxID=28901 RepID=UPI0009AACD63|nr:PagK family vesicle-borne virulence factor [Salmonella enterica]EBC2493067.1 hypothetical protein [Salmonella enterica subsp. enterica serovar Newport]EBW9328623.1 hypothetical protein [Salmonella enterica subsp. enterica serovar Arechavaleta]ECC1666914.1 hypothetical protein [Salmonella enterica subsp. diarizonae]EDO3787480.1 hypothetical protein [Salmonella enterica subsp. enterica serovar Infantis]EDU5729813.1 hypothetical protein [Salmonella enterica subsp. enterica serovar Typhimurium 